MFEIRLIKRENFTLVEIETGGGVIEATPATAEELEVALKSANVPLNKGVVISGRLPIWCHSLVAHFFHPAKWVAHFDPRLGGGVVAQSHDPKVEEFEVIPV